MPTSRSIRRAHWNTRLNLSVVPGSNSILGTHRYVPMGRDTFSPMGRGSKTAYFAVSRLRYSDFYGWWQDGDVIIMITRPELRSKQTSMYDNVNRPRGRPL